MELFFILLIFFILWPLFKLFFRVWQASRSIKQQYSNFAKSARESQRGYTDREQYNPSRRHKKIFRKTDGEYIDFEEISEERTTVEYTDSPSAPIIEDAKYEDIK